jgi:putative ATPase
MLRRALEDEEHGLGGQQLSCDSSVLEAIARAADGDARRALNILESCADLTSRGSELTQQSFEQALDERSLLYDKAGEEHYNSASAFIKSMRGTDPDAAVYWLMRMLEAGDDPLFLLRRMLIFASEDVGNADPRALSVAVSADAAFRRIGMPEGIYAICHACLYLASCPKSNAVGQAWQAARKLVHDRGALPTPKKLRNAVTRLMREEGYGEGYHYPHDFDDHFVPGESYLPDELAGTQLYVPSREGLEAAIAERLERLKRRS